MADITQVKTILDAYGVGVRAGVITPQQEDEAEVRKLMGLPVMSKGVIADWASTDGIRKPITLKAEGDGVEPAAETEAESDS